MKIRIDLQNVIFLSQMWQNKFDADNCKRYIAINWRRKRLIAKTFLVYVFKSRRMNSWRDLKEIVFVSRERKKERRKENKTDYRFAVGKKFFFFSPLSLLDFRYICIGINTSPNKFDAIKKDKGRTK